MIIKQTPEDFFVEELTELQPSSGPFALYRLEKRGWTTHDALQAIRRRWKVDFRRLSYGGLKDRHAHTIQYFSVYRGPQRNLTHQGVSVAYLGQIGEPYSSQHIGANRFRLTVRDLSPEGAQRATAILDEIRRAGVPNYFDDQRFGSISGGGEFVAKALLRQQHEEALRLALTAPYPFDRRPQKKEKALLRAHWGDWAVAKEKLARSHARSLVDYLVSHPTDFRGALERLRPELRSLYLSAYQSHLWNGLLAAWLDANVPAERLLRIKLIKGLIPMHRPFEGPAWETLSRLRLPLAQHRVTLDDSDPIKPLFERILADEGVTLDQFRLRGFKTMFFSRGDRPALCLPLQLQGDTKADDLHRDRVRLDLSFDLPRGAYATLLIKRAFEQQPLAAPPDAL